MFCGRLINWCVPLIRRRVVAKFQDSTPEDIEPRAKTLGLAVRKGGVIAIRILTGIGLLKVAGRRYRAPVGCHRGVWSCPGIRGPCAWSKTCSRASTSWWKTDFGSTTVVEINGVAGRVVDMTFRTIILQDSRTGQSASVPERPDPFPDHLGKVGAGELPKSNCAIVRQAIDHRSRTWFRGRLDRSRRSWVVSTGTLREAIDELHKVLGCRANWTVQDLLPEMHLQV